VCIFLLSLHRCSFPSNFATPSCYCQKALMLIFSHQGIAKDLFQHNLLFPFKETVSRDFRPPFFFINRWPLGP
jgi:hypothetical protein